MMKFFDERVREYPNTSDPKIFVFGSNLSGRHGAGAAHFARMWYGAVYGVGRGRTGESYAIPTKNEDLHSLALIHIEREVREFVEYARYYKDLKFLVTRVGCGLAGYTNAQIAPMFRDAPKNCIFERSWREFLI